MFKFFPVLLAAVVGVSGCVTAKRLPPVDLAQAGWTRHTGQAVWHYPPGMDLAGDILLAFKGNQAFVQFTKGGQFPVVTAQQDGKRWEAEFFSKRRVSARGEPTRISWLQLAEAVKKGEPSEGWVWTGFGRDRSPGGPNGNAHPGEASPPRQESLWRWKLLNRKSGETIEGFFSE